MKKSSTDPTEPTEPNSPKSGVVIVVVYTLALVILGLTLTFLVPDKKTNQDQQEVATKGELPNPDKPDTLETIPPPPESTTPTPTPDTGAAVNPPSKGVTDINPEKPNKDKGKDKSDTTTSKEPTKTTSTTETTLAFAISKMSDKYMYAYIIRNASVVPVTLTNPPDAETVLTYKIIAEDNRVAYQGTAIPVTNTSTTIDKERSEILYLDISTAVVTLPKGVYTLEVSTTFESYEGVSASIQFSSL